VIWPDFGGGVAVRAGRDRRKGRNRGDGDGGSSRTGWDQLSSDGKGSGTAEEK
jgi:hypothetical protein